MEEAFNKMEGDLKKETVRQLMALFCRWMGDPEEDLDRLFMAMTNNKDFKKGLSSLLLRLALRAMRKSTLVFMTMCEARLLHHDPDRGESYRTRPAKEHLGQLKKKVAALEAILGVEDSKQKVAMLCVDIANYAQFIVLARDELKEFLVEEK